MSVERQRSRLYEYLLDVEYMDDAQRLASRDDIIAFVKPALFHPQCDLVLSFTVHLLDHSSPVGLWAGVDASVTKAAVDARQDAWSALMDDMPTLRKGTLGAYDEFRFAWKFDGALQNFVDHLCEPWEYVKKLPPKFYLTVHVGPLLGVR
jgi:hypothetical protein